MHKNLYKVFTWLGFIFVLLASFYFGYSVGRTPTTDEQSYSTNYQTAVNDMVDISYKYKQLGELCEQKYQLGISGDISQALQVKGQMTEIQSSIDRLLAIYEPAKPL